ncbi:phage tail family protein [Nonomuraea recticatena]|uniref:Phage tail family protein n=1 Tax=Nonomuraea recticatena TaxID=46178 RepID=A0ABN3S3L5_9ACTN
MPYGWPSTRIEWANLTTVAGNPEPIPEASVMLTGGPDVVTLKGIQGFDAPPAQIYYDELSNTDGGYFREARNMTREVFIPVQIFGEDRNAFLTNKRNLLRMLNPARGLGRLTVTEGDSSARYLDCIYSGGAEGSYGKEDSGFLWQKYGLTFRAIDPYWYAGSVVEYNFSSASEQMKPFFGTPFFGLAINRTHSINQGVTLEITGDVDTWPTWLITGPCNGITFEVQAGATIRKFGLSDLQLNAGQQVFIDTRPGRRRITLVDPDGGGPTQGDNIWESLDVGDAFWAVVAGTQNLVTISMNESGSTSSVNLKYRPRFYSA